MSLKKRVLIFFIITNIILISIFLVIGNYFLISPLKKQREDYEKKLIKRTEKVIGDYLESFYIMSANWGEWDSMQDFVKNPTDDFIKENFPPETFGWDFLNLVVVKRFSGKILYSAFYNPKIKKFDDFRKLGFDRFTDRIVKGLLKEFPEKYLDMEYFRTPVGVLVCVFQLITNNKGENPSGIFILGGILGESFSYQLKSFLLEDVKVYYYGEKGFKKIVKTYEGIKKIGENIGKKGNNLLYMIEDYEGKPAAFISIKYDYSIFKALNTQLVYFVILLIIWWIVSGLFLYFNLNKYITERIIKIAKHMNLVKETKDLELKLKEDNLNDEISCLKKNINSAVEELRLEKINREKAEKSMVNNEKLAVIGKLASILSHELNSPLLALSNSIEIIKNHCDVKRKKELREIIKLAENEISYIRELIDGLLALNKKKLKKFKFISLKSLIRETTKLLKISKKIGDVKIKINIDQDCKIYGSPAELKQVLLNLLINSIEAMKSNGIITINAEIEGRYCVLNIKDNGPGLSEEVRDNLFEPFVFSGKKEGIGLGLYVSYKIIERHRGQITYIDGDEGAHFVLKLPMFKYEGGKFGV